MSNRTDDRPEARDRTLVFRLLSAVAAASSANALDHQLGQMLRAAFAAADPQVDVSDHRALAQAIEDIALTFREPRPSAEG